MVSLETLTEINMKHNFAEYIGLMNALVSTQKNYLLAKKFDLAFHWEIYKAYLYKLFSLIMFVVK